MANNSAVYEAKPTNAELMDEWVALMKSGSGERGIFNRGALEKTMPARRF
jgi:ribonucleoside-triphosphate reductase